MAQSSAVVGRVVDAVTHEPLPEANVVLRDPAAARRWYGTATDTSGRFSFRDVAPGRYRLVVTYVGYGRTQTALVVPPDTTVRRTIRLDRRSLPQDEVVVTTGRAEAQLTPVTASNLSAEAIDTRLVIKDVPSLLSKLPSTTFHSQNGNGIGYSTLRIRGFDQRRLAVAINGVPQNDPEDFNVFWVNLYGLKPSIRDIQVQRGAGSSLYGSVGIGGAINVVARPYRPEPYVRLRTGAGSFDTQRYSVEANTGLLNDRYVVYGRLSRVTSDGYRKNAWAEFTRYFGGVTRYGENSTLTLEAFGGPQHDGLAFSGISKSANDDEDARKQNPSAASDDTENFRQPQVHLSHTWSMRPDWTLDQTLFWIKGEGYFDFGSTFRSADYLRLPEGFSIDGEGLSEEERQRPLLSFGLPPGAVVLRGKLDQNQLGWIPKVVYQNGTTKTTLGLEARLHRSLRWGRIQEASDVIPDAVVGPEADERIYSFRGEKIITSAFGSHRFRPVDRLAVQADLQLTWRRYRFYDEAFFDRSFQVPYVFMNPRLGATLNPDRPLSAYASVAFAQREPRLSQLYDADEAAAGDPPRFERNADGAFDFDEPLVEPESLLDVELGGTLRRERYRLSANLFWMEFWDEIVASGRVNQFGKPITGNADRTRHVGLELEGRVRLLPGWDLSGNAMLARTRFVDFTEFRPVDGETQALERDGNPIAGFPEQILNARTAYQWRGWEAAVDVHAVGTQYVDNSAATLPDGSHAEEREIDPYALVDASLSYEPPRPSLFHGLRVTLSVDNVLNSKVLRHGFQTPFGPRFYPAATRNVFVGLCYTLR